MTSRFLPCAALALAVLAVAPAIPAQTSAQTPAPTATATSASTTAATIPANLNVDGHLITLPVVILDKKGNLVPNLTPTDFTLTDNTHPQTIQYFHSGADLPLILGLLVDTSGNQRNALEDERRSSEQFFNNLLTDAHDRAFVIQFAHEVDLLEDISASKAKLHQALDQVGRPQFGGDSNGGGSDDDQVANSRRRRGGSGTTLYDAIYLASSDVLQKEPERKAIIVLTDGVDRGSKETMNGAIEAAQRAGVSVYAIYFKGEEQHNGTNGNPGMGRRGGMGGGLPGGGGWPGSGGGWPGGGAGRGAPPPSEGSHVDGRKILEEICGKTGGFLYDSKKAKPDELYAKITEQLRNQYMLGYTPDKAALESGFHHIILTPKNKSLLVQAREGYYVAEE